GHKIGNHTYNHINGWETETQQYIQDVIQCRNQLQLNGLHSNVFRPPYGKVKRRQMKLLKRLGYKIVMWDILSADFDNSITPEKCHENVMKHIEPGSIVIFHD